MAIGAMPSIVLPADHVAGPPQGHWTYEEYADIPDDDARYELLTGVLYMSPPPTDSHQFANNLIQTYLTIHVQFAGLGRVIGPPFNIILSPTDVVQPDVTVVLTEHLDRITQRGVVGAPDLVVEIASPSTASGRARILDRGPTCTHGRGVGARGRALPFARRLRGHGPCADDNRAVVSGRRRSVVQVTTYATGRPPRWRRRRPPARSRAVRAHR
jgi:hypothetical protein